MDDEERVRLMAAELQRLGPARDLLEDLLALPWPEPWTEWTPARALIYLRQRLRWSQAEIARRAGMSAAHISRLERGDDARLGTWRKVYAAMGLGLLVGPRSAMSARQLVDLSEDAAPPHRRFRERARPRRR